MPIKVKLTADQVLAGCTAIVIGVTERKANPTYHNEDDVKAYPYVTRMAITHDQNGVNNGALFTIKLKKVDNLVQGQSVVFQKEKATVPNGEVHFWTKKNSDYVNVSIKGDAIINEGR